MKSSLKGELVPVFDAINILSSQQFLFAGQAYDVPAVAPVEYGQPSPPDPLVAHLQGQLYHHAYAHRFTGQPHTGNGATKSSALIQQLSSANQSRERWDPVWQVIQQNPDGSIFAQKGTTMGLFRAGQYTSETYQLTPGSRIRVHMPKESTQLQPYYYFAFGETPIDYIDEDNIFRLYWNVDAEGAPALVRWLSFRLNHFQVPFRFKAGTSPEMYQRRDSAVLYLNKRFAGITACLLENVPKEVKDHLQPDVPLFSKAVGRGIGFAEDPGQGESFGMNRCRIVAEGVVQAYHNGRQDHFARWYAVEQQFQAYGMDASRPYLNSHSADIFEFQLAA